MRRLAQILRPAIAQILVVALVASSAGPLLHERKGHDADFGPLVVHDASQHRVTARIPADRDGAADHCAACHLVRVVRLVGLEASREPLLQVAVRLADRSASAAHVSLDLQLPARAPPSLT